MLLTVLSPEQFDILYQALPDDAAQLLVETAIESGLRWGELTGLRRRDLNVATGMLTVSRVVTEINPQFHPEGGRFLVREYPKGKKHRRLKLSPHIVAKLDTHARADHLGSGDLFFTVRQPVASPPRLKVIPNPRQLGKTAPNQAGHRYQHGTLSGYNAGRCRCVNCKAAFAIYRAARRAEGRDAPRTPRTIDTDGHILRRWFRDHVWLPALEAADLGIPVRVHDLPR